MADIVFGSGISILGSISITPPPTAPLATTQSAGTNISAITGTQTQLLLNTPNNASFLVDSSTNAFTVTNNGSVTSNALNPF